MSLWQSRNISTENFNELTENKSNLKIVKHLDKNLHMVIAIDLDTMKSYILSYSERLNNTL